MDLPTPPFWFKQRQCKVEPAGEYMLKATGPILPEAYLRVERAEDGRWRSAVRLTPDGPDLAATDAESPDERKAWDASFELYRLHVIC